MFESFSNACWDHLLWQYLSPRNVALVGTQVDWLIHQTGEKTFRRINYPTGNPVQEASAYCFS